MIYQWKSGSHHHVDAQIAGSECEKLEKLGSLTAKNLVEASKDKSAPLHSEFEWDNRKAAASWREQQARNIINSIEIKTENSDPVRAYFNIVYNDPEYKHIDTIIKSEDDTQLLLKTAYGELRSFKRKYESIQNYLTGVMQAIDELDYAAN